MTLDVLIHRQQKGEPQEGRLRAWVVQEGQKGTELLRGRGRTVSEAKQAITQTMQKDAPGATLRFRVEDYRTAPPATCLHKRVKMDGICGDCGFDTRKATE